MSENIEFSASSLMSNSRLITLKLIYKRSRLSQFMGYPQQHKDEVPETYSPRILKQNLVVQFVKKLKRKSNNLNFGNNFGNM